MWVGVADAHDTDASPVATGSEAAQETRRGAVGLVRDRLTARLLDPSNYRVGWVVAPAGSGKSRLLAHVADRYPGPVAWCDTPDPVPRSEAAFVAWLWDGLCRAGLDTNAGEVPTALLELFDRVPAAGTAVETVGEVVDDAGGRADVLVGMDDARGHDEQHRPLFSHQLGLKCQIGRRMGAGVPEEDLERRRPQETEAVALIDMFVGTAGHARLGERDVAHYRVEFDR